MTDATVDTAESYVERGKRRRMRLWKQRGNMGQHSRTRFLNVR